jgi:hypothetical protein
MDLLFNASSITMRRIAASSASSSFESGGCSRRMFFLIFRPESHDIGVQPQFNPISRRGLAFSAREQSRGRGLGMTSDLEFLDDHHL